MTLDNRKITKELTNKIKTTSIKTSAARLSSCTLCPRNCKADRNSGKTGFCGVDSTIYLARAALHMWEEPCISGKKGSGAVFFSGCGLRCCFCQNHDIAIGSRGLPITVERLSEIFLELQEKGIDCNLEEIQKDIEERDERDMNRTVSPLKQAEDAVLVDSSEMGIDQVVDAILDVYNKKVQK